MGSELRAPGFILRSPRTWHLVGVGLVNTAGLLLVCGLIGHVGLTAMAAASAIGKQSGPTTLAQMYPTLSTWWIPERPVGYMLCAVVALCGGWLAVTAKGVMKSRGGQRGQQ